MRSASGLLLFLVMAPILGAQAAPDPGPITIESVVLGDRGSEVITRITFGFQLDQAIPPDTPVVMQGSVAQAGKVVRTFRYPLRPNERESLSLIQPLAAGEAEVDVRLLIPMDEISPILLAKGSRKIQAAATGKPYVAESDTDSEAVFAEGFVPEVTGAVRIVAPRRDLAPNLFIVDVDVKPPVKRVEFYVEGKKILARNAPPYRAELDLGKLPRRVEVRAVGYDAAGRYIDADAWLVNERENPLEVKITRTVTPDGVSHFKLSIQNQQKKPLKSVVLYAGDRKLFEWAHPPYAVNIAGPGLAGVEFVRAAAIDESGYDASDLMFLDGARYIEEIEVNLVELPVSVMSQSGAVIVDLKQTDFSVFENGKVQKISSFGFATDVPLSIGMLVDHSGSMKKRIADARKAASEFFGEVMGPKDKAFFGGFSWDASKLTPFISSSIALRGEVERMPDAEGATALYDAIVTALYRFRGVEGRKALIVVTDGEDTASRLDHEQMLSYVRSARVPIYFIGIGLSPLDIGVSNTVKGLAAETGGVAYFIRNVDKLGETYEQLEKELRTQYLVSYYTESTKKDQKYRTVEVKVKREGAKVRTIRGYIP